MKENIYKPQMPDVMEAIFDAVYSVKRNQRLDY